MHALSAHPLPACPIACAPAGKAFFKKKKQPVPVRLTGKDWAAQIRKACESTYLFWSGALCGSGVRRARSGMAIIVGAQYSKASVVRLLTLGVPVQLSSLACCARARPPTCAGGNSLTIKVARSSQSEQQCLENAVAAINAAVEKVPRKWDGVQVRSRVACSERRAAPGCTTGDAMWGRADHLLEARPTPLPPCLLRILQALFLKTADSVALPVWQVLPDAATKIE